MVNLRSPRARFGFTLIELLIAITILAIIAVLGWRGLDSILRSRTAITQDVEQLRGLQLAFSQLQSDCAHYVAPHLLLARPTLATSNQRLTLIRSVYVENQPSSYQVIAYRVVDGTLTRRASQTTRDLQALDALWNSINEDRDSIESVKLQTGVVSMSLQVWNNDNPGWHEQQAPSTKPPVPGAPPSYVTGLEMTVQLVAKNATIVKDFLMGAG